MRAFWFDYFGKLLLWTLVLYMALLAAQGG